MRAKIKRVVFYGAWLIRFSCCTVFYLIVSLPLRFNKKYKNLWLISERTDEARDNGYWLYKWILENKPDTNVRYVLTKESSDYKKMPRKDLIIRPNSAQHYICWILSSYSVSTHMHGACPGKSFCILFLPFARKKKTVFLQHGVTKNRINLRGGLDAIVAVSGDERDLLVEANPRYKNNVYVAGFCRYDQLSDVSNSEEEKIILVMPTFRKWLRDIGRLKDSDQAFIGTDYYSAWNSFLNNSKLELMMKTNHLKMIFFPHKEMQNLAKNFKTKNERIQIGKPGEYDIQDLLKKSSLLVTDYSSVLFDFAYMGKPVIFYQFDQKDFFTRHYISNGVAYPFGETVKNEEEVVNKIKFYINNSFMMEKEYKDEINGFFEYRDRNNCIRNYEMIKGL